MQQSKFGGVPVKESKFGGILAVDVDPAQPALGPNAWPEMPPLPNLRPLRDKNENRNLMMGIEPESAEQLIGRENQFYNLGQSDISDKVWNMADYTLERTKDYKQIIAKQRGLAEEEERAASGVKRKGWKKAGLERVTRLIRRH